jgi:hypothetical protein
VRRSDPEGLTEHQADLSENQRIAFRIGINLDDIITEDDDITAREQRVPDAAETDVPETYDGV